LKQRVDGLPVADIKAGISSATKRKRMMAAADQDAVAEAAQGRKMPNRGGRSEPGQGDLTGRHSAKNLKPSRKRKPSIRCAANGCFDPAHLAGIRGEDGRCAAGIGCGVWRVRRCCGTSIVTAGNEAFEFPTCNDCEKPGAGQGLLYRRAVVTKKDQGLTLLRTPQE
jgi:hypothetical protein